jgi:hypothetical protein
LKIITASRFKFSYVRRSPSEGGLDGDNANDEKNQPKKADPRLCEEDH